MKLYALAASALVLAVAPLQASASVDTSPKPGGVFKLKPGIFVEQNSTCEDPANAAIRKYDGKGVSGAHSRACRAKIVSRKGKTMTVSQSCIDAGAGPAPRSTERFQMSVENALEFTIRKGGRASTYRYCPSYQLPKGL